MISRAAHLAVRGDVEAAVISSAICSSRGFTLQVLGGDSNIYILPFCTSWVAQKNAHTLVDGVHNIYLHREGFATVAALSSARVENSDSPSLHRAAFSAAITSRSAASLPLKNSESF